MDLLLELTERYLEPHRHYHTLEHIAAMLHAGRQFPLDEGQVMAVWFHDAIYDPTSDSNEADSAALARQRLAAIGWSEPQIARVERMVLDTQRHTPSLPESEAVLDLDLMSLAVPWPEFAENSRNIRLEFAHVADEAFDAGRRAFLGKMLERERLYYTPFGARLEAAARANLRRAADGS